MSESRTYRNNSFRVGAAIIWTIAFTSAVVLTAQQGVDIPIDVSIALFWALVALAAWAIWWRPCVEVQPGALVVRNPVSSRAIPFGEIERISGGPFLTVRTRNHEQIEAWAVQAANIAPMLKRESHSDRVARELSAIVFPDGPQAQNDEIS